MTSFDFLTLFKFSQATREAKRTRIKGIGSGSLHVWVKSLGNPSVLFKLFAQLLWAGRTMLGNPISDAQSWDSNLTNYVSLVRDDMAVYWHVI